MAKPYNMQNKFSFSYTLKQNSCLQNTVIKMLGRLLDCNDIDKYKSTVGIHIYYFRPTFIYELSTSIL